MTPQNELREKLLRQQVLQRRLKALQEAEGGAKDADKPADSDKPSESDKPADAAGNSA